MARALRQMDLDNEIISLNYMGVVNIDVRLEKHSRLKECRQFLIARLRCLQLMFTNGISFWTKKVEGSDIQKPY